MEGRGVGYTHITGRHIGGDTDITSDMCMGYRYHGDTHITVTGAIIDYVQDEKNLGWTPGIKNGDTETALERRVNSIR